MKVINYYELQILLKSLKVDENNFSIEILNFFFENSAKIMVDL